ncbi:hypothetical protein [Piscirickettsia litoralis]|uniref:Uncharacterized protein n=1 Tax=Piscirickettsia litoralis TaxID=1891921 RepID=A0ABX3A0G9_9GAMM|nr:hypothetical protein [Piscirickettsia litoralis]ODN42357.1 hypothetical protein BGC07_04685 [Piscirickettsia litoralis]
MNQTVATDTLACKLHAEYIEKYQDFSNALKLHAFDESKSAKEIQQQLNHYYEIQDTAFQRWSEADKTAKKIQAIYLANIFTLTFITLLKVSSSKKSNYYGLKTKPYSLSLMKS